MCEFCVQHGEGKRWYLNARNYGEDLASDLRRQRFTENFRAGFDGWARRGLRDLERLSKAPRIVQALVRWQFTRKMKREHFGQVLPLEELEQVFGIVNSVVRVPCVCREVTRGKEARYCFGISVKPNYEPIGNPQAGYDSGPDTAGLEQLSKEDALNLMRDFEKEGLVHSVWTFLTPFIGGICNCDRSDCLAMISTVGHNVPVMFKGHSLAAVDWDKCKGCRSCMRQCQFGAIGYSAAAAKCFVDQSACYGCGICRSVCTQEAVSLNDRAPASISGK